MTAPDPRDLTSQFVEKMRLVDEQIEERKRERAKFFTCRCHMGALCYYHTRITR